MKKIILTVATIFAIGAVNAQEKSDYKPTKGTVSTEVGLTGGLNNAAFNLNTGVLKFRYFLKDDLGLRLGLGFNNGTTETIAGASPNQITTTVKNSNTDINLGIEKHFGGSDRLSTYGGADLVLGFSNSTNDEVNQNGNYNKSEGGDSSFGVRLFTGADYYIAKKLFLGVEAGLEFLSIKDKDNESSSSTGGTVVTTSTPGAKNSNLNTQVYGGVRIGYQF